ncbi:hypothetical protein FPQ18DRAFT_382840 [Pyronema domesticum]|nr:hypothetical protein FPQ18DRAFT_382840 [Pyronema domesticum]
MSIHDSWEDLPLNVMGYCSDDADMEADGGKNTKRTSVHDGSRSLYHSGNLAMCIHGIWECWLASTVTGHCSDDAAMEAGDGKFSKGFL